MSVQVWFTQDEISVRPGDAASLSVAVENIGEHTETYTIIPAGLAAAWTTVTRPSITLFGGSRDIVEVIIKPPPIHTTVAGATAISVRVIPQGDPEDAVIAETIASIEPFDDRRITMLQPLQRARRRATYEFMVENHGNNLASCRLHLVDASGRVDGSFDPPAVGVASGSTSLVRLRLKAQRGFFRRTERQLDFEIEASEPDHTPAAGRATLIQPPTLPARAVGKALLAVAALAALAGAWFGVVKPELRRASERAVDDRLAELATVTVPPPTAPVSNSIAADDPAQPSAPPPGAAVEVGEPVSYRIALNVAITQERSESISVPGDAEFRLTDLVLQNPNADLGAAQLLRNGEILYEWDLGAMVNANEFQPRISPLPFRPNDNIVLTVSCDAAGKTTGTGCDIAVLLGGVLVPTETG